MLFPCAGGCAACRTIAGLSMGRLLQLASALAGADFEDVPAAGEAGASRQPTFSAGRLGSVVIISWQEMQEI